MVINPLTGNNYSVTAERAEIMILRGEVRRDASGLRRLYVTGKGKPRGNNREWRKTPCIDPDTGARVSTMQLVDVNRARRKIG